MKPTLKIAMISYHTCPLAILGGKDTGGMNVYVRELTKELGRRGVHVDVFTRAQDEHAPHISHDLGYGNRVVHIDAGPPVALPKCKLRAYIPEFVEGILEFSRKKDIHYNLIHSHYWLSGIAAKALKDRWHIPVLHMFHTLGLMKQRVARSTEEAEGEYRIRGEHEVLEMADCVIASTKAEYAQLTWLYQTNREKIIIVPPGVDLSRFYPIPVDEAKQYIGIPVDHCMFLFVGRIEPLKGIDTLIHAIALMRDEGILMKQNLCLSIIGGDPDGKSEHENGAEMMRLKGLCEKYGLNNFVTFLGKRNQETLPYYYSAADVVIVPSHYESFGMVALEAMACGTPVVASQVGGLAFLVRDGVTGYHIPVGDYHYLKEKLINLMDSPELGRQMSRHAVHTARKYSWEIIAGKIIGVYRSHCRKDTGG